MRRLKDDSGMTIVEVMVAFSIILICLATLMGVIQLASKTLYVSGEFDNQTTENSEAIFADKNYSYQENKIVVTSSAINAGTGAPTEITFQDVENATRTFKISCSRVQTTDPQGQTYNIYTK